MGGGGGGVLAMDVTAPRGRPPDGIIESLNGLPGSSSFGAERGSGVFLSEVDGPSGA
jgi:hypothetical protein